MNKYFLYLLFLSSPLIVTASTIQDSTLVETFVPVNDTLHDIQPAALKYKKRNFETGFKNKYKTPEFIYETKAKATTSWDRFWEAVGRFFDRLFSFGSKTTATTAFDIFMKVLAFCIIAVVVYLIVRVILKKEGMWIFGRSRKKISVQDITEEDIRQMDFAQLIKETKAENNYKLAIRYYYLWVLKTMSNNEIIDWHWDKTNSDYLYEIKNTMLRKDFEYLSYLYDYSWYGDFPLDQASFTKAETAFLKTLNSL